MDFARQSVPKKSNANINEIISNAVAVVDNQLSMKHIKLEKNLEENIPLFKIDSNQMQQVFINLLVNASDAVQERSGIISVSSRMIEPYTVWNIADKKCCLFQKTFSDG